MAEMLLLVALELGWYSVTLRGAVRDKLDWAGSCQGEADGFGWVDPARREREKKEKRKKKKVSPGQDAGKRCRESGRLVACSAFWNLVSDWMRSGRIGVTELVEEHTDAWHALTKVQ